MLEGGYLIISTLPFQLYCSINRLTENSKCLKSGEIRLAFFYQSKILTIKQLSTIYPLFFNEINPIFEETNQNKSI